MEHSPLYLNLALILTTLLAVLIFYKSVQKSKKILSLILVWMAIQFAIALTGFYANTNVLPPRFLFAIGPPLIVILLLFVTPFGRKRLDDIDPKFSILIHVVRIPVEIVLFLVFLHKGIPKIMTFEGNNLDIIAGITAPLLYYVSFVRQKLNFRLLLGWNLISLGLLANIVSIAILSTPYPFQRFGFEQPNVAIFHFPFVWLPSVIVPIILLSQLVGIRFCINGIWPKREIFLTHEVAKARSIDEKKNARAHM